MYNPKLSDFLKEYKKITLLGIFWAGYWRMLLVMFGIGCILSIVSEIIG